ncbi:sugar kinase [Oceanispirochaeta sp.]|jgi:sugar/nucleoside kinase (ribokinase family)|uniref:sugar kinase n=1 Tax=Oceanispirochaeta sp. TaxID=2035350 RepID=UPI0026295084|nr:sugar kinase [Oceanispirochaeta sp.]MDA3957641.1 sugar kinase [Oceanispirochaeta sp.]
MARIYTIGEILVEIMRDSVDSPLNQTGNFLGPYPSGAPAIFISTVSQLNHEAKIWGGVAKDKFGELLIDRLESDGVDCSNITVSGKGATAVAFVSYSSDGSREFIYHIDGTPAGDVKFDESGQTVPDYFHVMGCSLMVNDSLQENICRAVEWAGSKGARISFDPNLRPELLGDKNLYDVVGPVIDQTSIFLPGVDELLMFSDSSDVDEAVKDVFSKYPKMEIIHLKKGKCGSTIYTRDKQVDIPIYPIERVLEIVDPTGAGDSFDAAFLCGLAEDMSLEDAGNYASKAGAINSTVYGPMGGDMKLIHHDFMSDAE